MDNAAVKPLNTKDLLRMHGPTGGLVRRVQRFAWIGWGLFFLTATIFLGYVFLDKIMPSPVLAVDEEGRVLGRFEYLDPTVRTDQEIIGAGVRFLRSYLSANSDFIMEDYAEALNMMDEKLRSRKLKNVIDANYLNRIQAARSTSRLVLKEGTEQSAIQARKDLRSIVRYRGEVVAQVAGGNAVAQPFDITLKMEAVSRTSLYTYGFKITDIIDN